MKYRHLVLTLLITALGLPLYMPRSAYSAGEAKYHVIAAPSRKNSDLGYWAAVSQGYFKEAGVDVVSEDLETRVLARDAVSSGSVNLSHVSINTALPSFELGEPIKVVGSVFPRYPIVAILNQDILKDNGMTADAFHKLDAKDRLLLLKDKNIGLAAAGGLEDQTLRAQLKAVGVSDPDSFAQIQYVQSFAALEANFLQGRLDAIVSDAANGVWYSERGQGVQLLTGDEQDRYLPETVIPAGTWIVNTDWLAKGDNREALRAFLSAWNKGTRWVASLPKDDLRQWVLDAFPEVTDPTAQDKLVLTAETNIHETALDGKFKEELLQRVVNFALDQKTIKKPVDVNEIYTWEYLP